MKCFLNRWAVMILVVCCAAVLALLWHGPGSLPFLVVLVVLVVEVALLTAIYRANE